MAHPVRSIDVTSRRRQNTRILLVTAAAVAAAVGFAAAPALSSPTPAVSHHAATPATDTGSWSPCTDATLSAIGAECTYVPVPLDYSHPNGPMIQLAVSRVAHTSPTYQGVVLVNPGGPGGSGLDLSRIGAYLPDGVGAQYDWIGFDPRGVGSSIPSLSCDPQEFGADRPNYEPTSFALLRTWVNRSRSYAKACAAAQPALLRHLHTTDQARDMDRIRATLGVSQINYYGASFGTYLGSVYNTLFPGRMRRAVLDSNVDPRDVWYPLQFTGAIAQKHSMELFWRWIAQHNDIYGLGHTADSVERGYYALRAQLTREPAAGVVGPDELDDAFNQAAYDPQYWWPYLAEDWSNYVLHGDTHWLVADYELADGPGDDNASAVYHATVCSDAHWPGLGRELTDVVRTASRARFDTWATFWFNAPCMSWPAPSSTPITLHAGSLAPLLLDDYSDAVTPYVGDLEVRRLYPRGGLVGMPGSNHGVTLAGSGCVDAYVAAYLATGALPTRRPNDTADGTCPAMPTPIPVTYPGTPTSPSTAAVRVNPVRPLTTTFTGMNAPGAR